MSAARRHPDTQAPGQVGGTATDRAALVRSALRTLVAANGLHGTAMSAVAAHAGVATGTAYVHYASKDDLVLAAYREAKLELGRAATAQVDPAADPSVRFEQLWLGVYRYLSTSPDRAQFLVQIESSPYARQHLETTGLAEAPSSVGNSLPTEPQPASSSVANDSLARAALADSLAGTVDEDDPLVTAARAPDMACLLLPLPLEVLFDLGIAPAIRLVAAGAELDDGSLMTVAHACWRAISLPTQPTQPTQPS